MKDRRIFISANSQANRLIREYEPQDSSIFRYKKYPKEKCENKYSSFQKIISTSKTAFVDKFKN